MEFNFQKEQNTTNCIYMSQLEDIMLSEVSQTQKDKSCMVSLMWGVKKTKSQQQTQNAEPILTGNSMVVAAAAAAKSLTRS